MLHDDKLLLFVRQSLKEEILFKEDLVADKQYLRIADYIYRLIKNFLIRDLDKKQLSFLKNNTKDINSDLNNKYFNKFSKIDSGYSFKLDLSQVNLPILNINIVIKDNSYKDTFFGYNDSVLELVFPLLDSIEDFSLITIKKIFNNKISIIHEITHFLDDIETDGDIFRNTSSNYYNSKEEIHAYYIQLLSWIRNYISYNKEEFIFLLNKYGIEYFNEDFIIKLLDNELIQKQNWVSRHDRPYELSKYLLSNFIINTTVKVRQEFIEKSTKYIQDLIQQYKNRYTKSESIDSYEKLIEYLLEELPL